MLKVGFNRHFQTCIAVLALFLLSAAASAQPAFSQPPEEAATYGTLYTYTINTDYPTDRDVTLESALPSWLTFTPHPNGTATLTGTPDVVGAIPTITIKVADRLLPLILFSTQDINITVAKATPTVTWNNPAAIIYGTQLSATQLNATADVPGTFNYTPAAGTVLNAGMRTLSVDFTPTDAVHYNSVIGTTVALEVDKATPLVTWANPADITYPTALGGTQLNATADVAGSFTYTPASGTVLNAGNRTLSVDFAPDDANNYNPVNGKTVAIIVHKATPVITWGNPADITYPTALSGTQLNATANVAGTFTYTPAAGAVLNAGTRTLSVDFAPDDATNYNPVNGRTVTIEVHKGTPVITWGNPAPITYPTALSGTQLNATANVAGSFAYTPAAGVVLNAGTRTLSVNFTPTDANNYNPVNGTTVTIEVNKATPVITWANPSPITYGTALSGTQLNATASVAGSFTYTPAAGTVLNAGTRTLSVDFTPTDAVNYNSVGGTTVTIEVNKATPVITWTDPSAITYGTALGATQLNATANVAGSFNYTPAAGTVLNAGSNQNLLANFTPTDGANYNTVENILRHITVNKATPVVTWGNPAAIVYGTPLSATQLNATADVAGSFAYTPASGTVLNAGTRTLSLDFTPADAANYNPVTGRTVTLQVDKATPVITWANPAAITYLTPLGPTQLNATADVAGSFAYTPASGTVLNAGVRTLSVNFTPTDAANYNSVIGRTVTIDVQKATPTVNWANPAAITYLTPLSATQLNATASVPGTFIYNPGAGTVLDAGANQVLSVGFTPTDVNNYNTVPVTTVLITVNRATPNITWGNPAAITYTTPLSATQLNATASVPGTFVYTPAAGTILNAGAGQVLSVNFTPSDAANYNSVNGTTVTINVNKATPVITWNNPAPITYGTALSATQLNATADVAGSFAYSPAAGVVLNTGASQVLSANFTPADAANYNSVTNIQRQITVIRATPTVTWSNPGAITYGTALGATQLNATASVPGTFAYSPAAGAILPAGAGHVLSVNFTPTDGANYNPVNGTTVTITVNKATPVITWANPAAITYGTALGAAQLNATANVAGTFDYTPAGGTVLNAGTTTLSVDFTPSDTQNYNPVNGTTASIVVNKATPIITWANPAAIVYGTALGAGQLNASANVAGSFTYTPPAGTVLNAGASQTLSVNFAPTDAANYNPVNNTQRQITVNKATPTVTWATPGAITYGTPLSGTQLNSTFSVPGSPVYVPGAGTILPVGSQPLVVNWTPTDQANYNSVNGTQVFVTVNKATPVITWGNPANITYGTALTGVQLNATASVPGSFAYTPNAGTVLNAGNGQTLTAIFTPTDQTSYNIVTGITATINVLKANPVITWGTPAAITYGTALSATQLNASASVAGVSTYSPPSGTVLNAGTNQALSSTFTPTDLTNYNVIVTPNTITVNKATPTITWPTPGNITYGTPLTIGAQLAAVGSVPGTPVYSPLPGTILNAGAGQTLSVTYTPTDGANYNVATASRLITVDKATPVVTWATPLPIKTGVALDGTQLNATADVPGARIYTPAAGTSYPTEGTYTLSVRFEPTDAANYNVVPVTQVQLTVSSKENPVITWNTPADITYGTLLSSTQNSATANVGGTYAYSPANGVRLNAGAGQTLTVTFTPTDGVNYNVVQKTVQINVNKATLTATASNASRNYGAANPSFVITYTGFVGAQTAAVIDSPPTATCSAIVSDPAGSTFAIIPAGGSDNNYQFSYANGTLTINKALLTATAENKTREYGISNPEFTIIYAGFVNGDDQNDIVQPTASTTAVDGSSVGNYTISLTGGSASNYNITLQPGTLAISKALLVVLGNNLTKVYGQPNPALTFAYIGFRNNDTQTAVSVPPTASTTATQTSGIGTYSVSITGGSATNYQLQNFPGSLLITKAPLTAKADNKTRVYGGLNPPNSITYTGFANTDGPGSITQPTLTGPAATSTSDAGTYPIQLSGGSAANYDLTLQNGTLTITKATLNAKADNKSRAYGQNNPTFTLTYSGFLNGDDAGDITPPVASTTATVASPVATYVISVSGGSATNYSFTYQSGSLTVDPASLIVKANDRTRMYGQDNPTLTVSYTGFLNGDDAGDITVPTASTTATAASNTGTYAITLSGGSALNYTLTLQSGTLTVTKATLTAKADDKTKVYGTVNPSNSISYTGFVNGDDVGDTTIPTISGPGTTNNSPVGVYPITLSGGSATNYVFVLQNGALTITQATLTAKADNKSRSYGGANPPFTITYTGFIAGDNAASITEPVASTTADLTSNVGTYPITLSGTTANYAFTFQPGTLTVNKTSVLVTADNRTKVYGANIPVLTMTYSGLLNGDALSVIDTPPAAVTTATAASPVGNYPVTLSGGVDNNYTFTYAPGTLTVSKAPLTAKADNKLRFYGDPNPPNSITYTGFVNGDTPSSITQPVPTSSATPTSPLGDYPIILTGGSSTNYTITLQPGTLSVIPAILTVTAVNQSKTYGSPNPVLTLTYSGFATGHSVADIDVLPIATTSATIASNVGTYPITVSGGLDGNYAFVYASGTLNVMKAPLTATADNKTTTYGTVPPLTITYSGFMNGENPSVLDTSPAISTTATVTSPPAIYPIALTGGVDNNYNITSNPGAMTIGKATLTAKADDKSRITGVANPALTITYTGFMNNETPDVLDVIPIATTAAITASPAGGYAIDVAGGSDGNYAFVYQPGTLTVVLDNPPVLKNFQVETEEDKQFNFTLALFAANTTDEPSGKIFYVKVMTLPQNGTLFRGATRVVAGDEIKVTDGVLEPFHYMPNSNYNGSDTFTWNLFDGSYLAVNPATITVKVTPVNDPPVLSNIEPEAILYSPGDPKVQLSNELIVNDIDDSDVWSATVSIHTNFTRGDLLEVEGISPKITVQFDTQKGELNLTGKDARSNYETALRKVTFTSPVSASEIISDKSIGFVVRDSLATSNITSRILSITEVLPEVDIVNAFTPNADGVNDKWDVLGLGAYSKIDIRIFDTHGNLVFTCTEKVCEWDGTVNGKALPAGPYLYSIDLNEGKRKYKGLVTILK